jgi:hypothetical protein
LIKTIYLIIDLIFLGVLIFGIIQSKKHSFLAGFYSFLILLLLRLYSFVAPYTTKLIIDNVSEPPLGSSIGEFIAFINIIPRTLNLIAFSILIIGLYHRLKN